MRSWGCHTLMHYAWPRTWYVIKKMRPAPSLGVYQLRNTRMNVDIVSCARTLEPPLGGSTFQGHTCFQYVVFWCCWLLIWSLVTTSSDFRLYSCVIYKTPVKAPHGLKQGARVTHDLVCSLHDGPIHFSSADGAPGEWLPAACMYK